MKLEDFVLATNLARFQRILDESKDDAERQTIRRLVVEELAKRGPTAPPPTQDLIFHTEPEA